MLILKLKEGISHHLHQRCAASADRAARMSQWAPCPLCSLFFSRSTITLAAMATTTTARGVAEVPVQQVTTTAAYPAAATYSSGGHSDGMALLAQRLAALTEDGVKVNPASGKGEAWGVRTAATARRPTAGGGAP